MLQKEIKQPQKNSRIMNAMRLAEQTLMLVPFRTKFYDLTASYVFHFDIKKVVNDESYKQIIKFSRSFFMFLTAKLLFRFVSPQSEQKKITQANLNFGKRENSLKTEVVAEKSMKKNRVYTTHDFSNRTEKGTNKYRTESNIRSQLLSKKPIEETQPDVDETKLLAKLFTKSNALLQQAYFQLNECFNDKYRVKKIQIICFLITLIAKSIFIPVIDSVSKIFSAFGKQTPHISDYQNQSSFQQEVYIVLTYQTLGNLVSDNVFKYLKRKYIKQTIFNADQDEGYYKLIKSLNHIKEKLNQNDRVLIKKRRQRAGELKELRKKNSLSIQENEISGLQNLKKILQENLKTRQQIDFSSLNNIKRKLNSTSDPSLMIAQAIYPSDNQGHMTKTSFHKDSLIRKFSKPIKTQLYTKIFRLKNAEKLKINKQFNEQKIYKVGNPEKKIGTQSQIKSERNSYKFSKIPLESESNPTIFENNHIIRDAAERMKLKLNLFKQEALKDLEAIEKFNPLKSKQSNNWSWTQKLPTSKNCLRKCVVRRINLLGQKQDSTQKQKRKTIELRRVNRLDIEKQSVWHPLYNIRNENAVPIKSKKREANLKYLAKLCKKSDTFRKEKNAFEIRY